MFLRGWLQNIFSARPFFQKSFAFCGAKSERKTAQALFYLEYDKKRRRKGDQPWAQIAWVC